MPELQILMTGIAFGESPRRPPAGRRREGLGESAAQARAARCNRGSRRRLATATQGPTSFPGFSSWPDRPFETLLVVALAGVFVGGVLSEGHTGQVLGSPRSSTARGACYPPT